MSDPQIDPAGSTQQFRAFAQGAEPEAAPQKKSPVVPIAIAVVVLAVIAVVAYLMI
ncbi:hypothetical protein AB0D67_29455 [Streptosporangium sp. NPDC048047]|uniref:hypothetical protein n=1 Tax=unclassified Streptosporangium TaxID=2632669 RepID=UPI003436C199